MSCHHRVFKVFHDMAPWYFHLKSQFYLYLISLIVPFPACKRETMFVGTTAMQTPQQCDVYAWRLGASFIRLLWLVKNHMNSFELIAFVMTRRYLINTDDTSAKEGKNLAKQVETPITSVSNIPICVKPHLIWFLVSWATWLMWSCRNEPWSM